MNTTDLCKKIIDSSIEESKFKPFPHNMRQKLITHIVLVNEVPKEYLCTKVCTLDSWNEISGWFHSNIDHPVIDTTKGSIDIPKDIDDIKYRDITDSLRFGITAGDHILDKNYNVYRCYGWNNASGSSEIYFDFV